MELRDRGKGKRMIRVNNIKIHYICAGKGL
jgi:hypothetical protein